jgi:hypothetical protein
MKASLNVRFAVIAGVSLILWASLAGCVVYIIH